MTINTQPYFPDLALIEIAKQDDLGSGLTVTTQISSWSESGFGRPVETVPYFGNAKVKFSQPQEDGEVAFDVSISNAQWYRMFHGGTGSDFTSGSAQDDYRITVLVRDSNTIVSGSDISDEASLATGSISGTGNALRVIYADANLTGFEPEMDSEGYLKGTITFTVPPTDETSAGNLRIQEKAPNAGSELMAIGSYTSVAKW